MNSQQLLYINIILGGIFLLYFFLGRSKPKDPTRLNLRGKDTPLDPALSAKKQQPQIESKMTILEPETEGASAGQKNLAIFFIYNGHDWEAHSVLGVAQGAHMKAVTESYQSLLATSDPKSYEFLEAAYKAILAKKRRDVL